MGGWVGWVDGGVGKWMDGMGWIDGWMDGGWVRGWLGRVGRWRARWVN